MARIAGRNARVYIDITGSGSAEPVPFIKSFTVSASVDRYDVTAFGDSNKTSVQGLPDAKGNFSGFYDDTTAQMYTAASDGVARKSYFYPNISTPTDYWFTTAFWDFDSEFPVDGAATISGSWAASTSLVNKP